MFHQLLVAGLLLQAATNPSVAKPPADPSAQATSKGSGAEDPAPLLKVTRIYVDSFGDDIVSKELQSMIVSSLVATKRFKVTENRERADAVLKGTALEKTSQELHAYGEATSVGGASGHADSNGGGFVASHMGINDSSAHTETINEARIAIRLVNQEGDVIWTSTQESKGAKYMGSSADVADKCVKQLLHDVEKIEGGSVPSSSSAIPTSGQRK